MKSQRLPAKPLTENWLLIIREIALVLLFDQFSRNPCAAKSQDAREGIWQ